MAELPENSSPTGKCINCESESVQNYCPICGQKVHHQRFTVKSFFVSLLAAFNIERGFLFTFKMMFVNPGKVVKDYISGRTRPYSNPMQYTLVAAGIYAFLILWLKIFDQSIETTNHLFINDIMKEEPEALEFQQQWIVFFRRYVNFFLLLMIPFSSLVSKWYYRSAKLWYGEHLILNSYMFAQGFYITILLTPLVIFFPSLVAKFGLIVMFVDLVYIGYTLNRTFKGSVLKSLIGAFLVYFLGLLFFIVSLSLVIMLMAIILSVLGIDIRQILG